MDTLLFAAQGNDAWNDFWYKTWEFLSLVFRGLGIGLLVSIPLGVALTRARKLASPVMSAFALIQTVPSLALLAFCVSMLQMIGGPVAVVSAVVYSLFPIVLNTYTGIVQVSPRLTDAARGLGMTDYQVLTRVELPLALPVIMAGVRTGAVYAIGMITICAIVGAGGLGAYITTGIDRGKAGLILLGVVPILVITTAFFLGLGAVMQVAKRRPVLGLRLGGGVVLAMAAYAVLIHPAVDLAGAALAAPAAPAPAGVSDSVNVTDLAADAPGPDQSATRPKTLAETWRENTSFWPQTYRFLSVALRGLGLALLIGVPVGVALTRSPRLARPVIDGLALVQTIPSLALLGFCLSLFSLFGVAAATVATVVYSLFPIVLNTYTGIVQVDPRLTDAAKGMGMTGTQILTRVELPLALPVIIAGVRTAATYAIAMVTICALVGARGLGEYILTGMSTNNTPLILLGVIPILLLSFCVFWTLGGIAWLAKTRGTLGQSVSVVLILVLSVYGIAEPFFRHRADVRIGSKTFVESHLLAEMMRLMIEDHTDLTVEVYPNLGSNFGYTALRAGVIDLYPEYTGTLLTNEDALAQEVPEDKSRIESIVRAGMKKRFDLILLDKFGLNNVYAVAVPPEVAARFDPPLTKTSDLAAHPELKINVDQVFMDRPDGWKNFRRVYGLNPEQPPKQFNPNFMYRSLRPGGDRDVVIGFATDWQMSGLTILDDDRHFFPDYHAAPLTRADFLQEHPELGPILNKLGGRVDDDTIRRLNLEVAQRQRRPEDVACEFLIEQGLISKK